MHRQQFIAEASRLFAESTDYQATLQAVAHLAVPDIADWCVVDLVQDDGSLARVAIAHKDHTQQVPQSIVSEVASDPERLRLLHRLGLHSYVCSPMTARGRVLGTITFFTDGSRAFGPDDVAMVEDLARRSAMAIENARLYQEAQRASRLFDEMHAFVSHDLPTALSAIMLATEVQIANAPDSDEGRRLKEAAHTCRRAAQHIGHLISALGTKVTPPARFERDRCELPGDRGDSAFPDAGDGEERRETGSALPPVESLITVGRDG